MFLGGVLEEVDSDLMMMPNLQSQNLLGFLACQTIIVTPVIQQEMMDV